VGKLTSRVKIDAMIANSLRGFVQASEKLRN